MRVPIADAEVLFSIGEGTRVAHLATMCHQRDQTDRAIVEFGGSAHPGDGDSLKV